MPNRRGWRSTGKESGEFKSDISSTYFKALAKMPGKEKSCLLGL